MKSTELRMRIIELGIDNILEELNVGTQSALEKAHVLVEMYNIRDAAQEIINNYAQLSEHDFNDYLTNLYKKDESIGNIDNIIKATNKILMTANMCIELLSE